MPFHGLEYNLKGQHLSWKDVYLNLKDDNKKKIVYCNFNILNENGDEWDNLQSQVQEYTKKHDKNGWEIIIIMK